MKESEGKPDEPALVTAFSTAEGLLCVDAEDRAVVKDSTEGEDARVIGGSCGMEGKVVDGGGFGGGCCLWDERKFGNGSGSLMVEPKA